MRSELQGLQPEARFPLVQLAIPAIREISPQQYKMFRENISALVMADQKIDPFEFALQQVVFHHLDHEFDSEKTRPRTRHHRMDDVMEDCRGLFLFLAFLGHENEQDAAHAYHAAMKVIDQSKDHVYKPPVKFDAAQAARALSELSQAAPALKKLFIKACAAAVEQDGRITCEEAEMIRAFADVLDCPLPPVLVKKNSL